MDGQYGKEPCAKQNSQQRCIVWQPRRHHPRDGRRRATVLNAHWVRIDARAIAQEPESGKILRIGIGL